MGLPDDITKVDAVYERPGDNHILFFTGKSQVVKVLRLILSYSQMNLHKHAKIETANY